MLISLERGFRAGQALLLLGIGGVFALPSSPAYRNLKSMFIGYRIYMLGYESYNSRLACIYRCVRINATWHILQPLSYDVALVVWVAGLWSYSPPRNPDGKMEMETKSDKAGIIALTSPRYFSLGQDP